MPTTNISRRALGLVVGLCGLAIAFDGYDLVVYGTTIPSLLKEWQIGPAEAGRIGGYALIGMLVGALLVGTITDLYGRRKTLIGSVTWFSVFTALCAAAPSPEVFGALRFLGGIGLGGLMPIACALIIEYAPAEHRNLTYVVMQSGYAVGGILAASLAIPLIPALGWHVMYLIGAAPVVLIVPLALRYLPESLEYLVSRGRTDEAAALAKRLGIAVPPAPPAGARWYDGVRTLFSGEYRRGTVLLWIATFCALLMVYGMNTWLPQIMRAQDYALGSALSFLLVFNLGSIVGSVLGGRAADRIGSKPVIATAFLLAAVSIGLLSLKAPTIALYALFAVAGYGTIGTQNLINVHVGRYYPASARATGVGWSLGFGRLGAILGPIAGGLILGSGLSATWNFYLFAAVAVVGLAATALIPVRAAKRDSVALAA
ncbi:MFS transporter [Umezawaea sp. NPDC059074]|uniref:MFS transporter n=1 Tax=Umezawaea sp. NPDC059074 TaxID=3346716 RepID=UPI0036B0461F